MWNSSSRKWAWVSALLLCFSLNADAAPAKGKGKGKKPAGSKNSALSNALNDKTPVVQKCAIDNALDKGAKKVDVAVRVTINNKGGVVDSHVDVKVEGGDGAKVKACVEEVIKTAKFPAVNTPMATDERNWSIASQ